MLKNRKFITAIALSGVLGCNALADEVSSKAIYDSKTKTLSLEGILVPFIDEFTGKETDNKGIFDAQLQEKTKLVFELIPWSINFKNIFDGKNTSGYIFYDHKTRSVKIPCFEVTTIAKFGDGIEGETIYYKDVSMKQRHVNYPIFHVDDMTKTDSCESFVPKQYISCKEIKDAKPNSKDGVYAINPTGSDSFNVYCDMTTDGGGWTIIARSTTPSTWEVSNQYALGHFDYWTSEENYTYDYRVFLDSLINGDQAEVRFYDHKNPSYMDIRYSFNKNHLLTINLDDEGNESVNISRTDIKTTFDKSVKAVTRVSSPQQINIFRIHQKDSYAVEYCGGENTKSAINIINNGGCNRDDIIVTVCSKGLSYNQHAARGQCGFVNYNNNDVGKRVSIAFR